MKRFFSLESYEKPYFFLEADKDITNSFLNSLYLLLSNSLHSERSMEIWSSDWKIFFKFENHDIFISFSSWML